MAWLLLQQLFAAAFFNPFIRPNNNCCFSSNLRRPLVCSHSTVHTVAPYRQRFVLVLIAEDDKVVVSVLSPSFDAFGERLQCQ